MERITVRIRKGGMSKGVPLNQRSDDTKVINPILFPKSCSLNKVEFGGGLCTRIGQPIASLH